MLTKCRIVFFGLCKCHPPTTFERIAKLDRVLENIDREVVLFS